MLMKSDTFKKNRYILKSGTLWSTLYDFSVIQESQYETFKDIAARQVTAGGFELN